MKRKINRNSCLTTLGLLLLTAGLAISLYPGICQYLYRRQAAQTIRDYEERIKAYSSSAAKSADAQWDWLYQLIVQYNEELYRDGQARLTDAFSYQQVDFSLVQFGFDEELFGYISIPKMDIELPIYLGANRENMMNGAAHLTQTSLPVGGVNTNSVLAAHRGMSTAAMFRDIEELTVGDEIYITNFRETLAYRVAATAIIDPADIEMILIQEGQDRVTLITCHPYRHNYQRYIVRCERIKD